MLRVPFKERVEPASHIGDGCNSRAVRFVAAAADGQELLDRRARRVDLVDFVRQVRVTGGGHELTFGAVI